MEVGLCAWHQPGGSPGEKRRGEESRRRALTVQDSDVDMYCRKGKAVYILRIEKGYCSDRFSKWYILA